MMSIMDDLAGGQPVATTYLELWCRTFDESFVTLSKPREMAFHSGFTGQRAERMWKDRLKILRDLGFIMLEQGPSGPFSYALLLNPYRVIKKLYEDGNPGVRVDKYNALSERAIEIDDESLANPPIPAAPLPPNPFLAALAMQASQASQAPAVPLAGVAVPPPPQILFAQPAPIVPTPPPLRPQNPFAQVAPIIPPVGTETKK
jgi:hypothetical protein